MEIEIAAMLAEYGPLGISLGLIALIWFKTSKDHQEVINTLANTHKDSIYRIADALTDISKRVDETNRTNAEIKGIVSVNHARLMDAPMQGGRRRDDKI